MKNLNKTLFAATITGAGVISGTAALDAAEFVPYIGTPGTDYYETEAALCEQMNSNLTEDGTFVLSQSPAGQSTVDMQIGNIEGIQIIFDKSAQTVTTISDGTKNTFKLEENLEAVNISASAEFMLQNTANQTLSCSAFLRSPNGEDIRKENLGIEDLSISIGCGTEDIVQGGYSGIEIMNDAVTATIYSGNLAVTNAATNQTNSSSLFYCRAESKSPEFTP